MMRFQGGAVMKHHGTQTLKKEAYDLAHSLSPVRR